MNEDFDRSSTMQLIAENLARAHMDARLEKARELRAGHQVVAAKRLARKAERAKLQARLALARLI